MLKKYVRELGGFSRNARLYLLTLGLSALMIDGVYAVIFNLYLLRLEYDPVFIGRVNSVGLLIFALTSMPAGWMGNRWGSRRTMIAGICIILVGGLTLPLAGIVLPAMRDYWLLVTYTIMFLGYAIFFVTGLPFLLGVTTGEQRNHAFSAHTAIYTLAGLVGGLLGGLLPGLFATLLSVPVVEPVVYRLALWTAVFLALPALWASLSTTQERPQQAALGVSIWRSAGRFHPERFRIAHFQIGPVRRAYIGLLVAVSVVRVLQVAGMAVSNTFFNVYMDQGLNVPIAQIGLISSAARLSSVPAALAMAGLATRWGNRRLVVLAGAGTILGLLPLALIPLAGAAAAGLFIIAISSAIRYPAYLAYSMAMVREDQRQTMSGLSEMTAGISFAGMALLGGYMITTVGYTALFLTGAFFALVGTLFFVTYFNRPRGVAAQPTVQAPAGIGD